MSYSHFLKMNKNKQYKIEKGLLLFTQPRSPYFYGKFRINGKYRTQSFAPISNIPLLRNLRIIFNFLMLVDMIPQRRIQMSEK